MLEEVFQRFIDKSPTPVMLGGTLERLFSPEKLDALFERTAQHQYTRELFFSTVFELMSKVVCGIQPSMHAAYQDQVEQLSVSITSVYNKLNGIEPATAEALVSYSRAELAPLVEAMQASRPPALPGYCLKIVDGHCLDATEHRLEGLRLLPEAALPGKVLVVYEPALGMVSHVVGCEDGHAQERRLLPALSAQMQAGDVWLADRNLCVRTFLSAVEAAAAYFIVRHHQQLNWASINRPIRAGRTETGDVYEQRIRVRLDEGTSASWRRILLILDEPTRDGDGEIELWTNLPAETVGACKIAQLYHTRWHVERAFQELATHLNAEINTLGYPRAALFAFCVALVAYNILAVVQAALRKAHGAEKIDREVSGYYLANEIGNTWQGMLIAIPAEAWTPFRQWSVSQMSAWLLQVAHGFCLRRYRKHPRGPKKKQTGPAKRKTTKHVSTARVLAQQKST